MENVYIYIYIYIYITIIIKSSWNHRFLLLFFVIHPYRPSLPIGRPYKADLSPAHLVLLLSWPTWVFAGCPALVCPCVGVHQRTSLMSLYLILRQCSAYLVWLTWMVCEMGGKWLYSCSFVVMDAASRICSKQYVVFLLSSLFSVFSMYFVWIQEVHPYKTRRASTV